MSFAEKMQVWTLVLEYAKVVLGYPVTIPLLILALCLLFRERIGLALDALQELTFPGGGVKLRERAAFQKVNEDIERTKEATAYAVIQQLPLQPPKSVEAIASFFALTARILLLVPKAERRQFIEQLTDALPPEFKTFRLALFKLAEETPEFRALSARDVIITPPTGSLRFGVEERGDVDIPPAPKV